MLKGKRTLCGFRVGGLEIPREWETSQVSLLYLQSLTSFDKHYRAPTMGQKLFYTKVLPVPELIFGHVSKRQMINK